MPLSAGERLGPYEIISPLGAGGMGQVYRAKDIRLNRDVAIKVSSEQFTDRFSREAYAVAALNHPNICTLHDVGPNYLVMEYVEGQPLSGPMPVADALHVADQILAALDHAHGKGIIHRDLKPANILVSRQGVKLLDFGLAKVQSAIAGHDVTMASALTSQGMILGTIQYMSPEQLEGREADARSDIFSFGCVLHELITGSRPFDASSPAGLIAAILQGKPVPLEDPTLNRVVATCLAKDPDERWQTVRELRHVLRWAAAPVASVPPRASSRSRSWAPWLVAAVATIAAAGLGGLWPTRTDRVAPISTFALDAPPGAAFNFLITATAVSPDGQFLVFRAGGGDRAPSLWLRSLDSLDARQLPGTEGGDFPFWSPDSRSIAFFSRDELKRLDIVGGSPAVLCESVSGATAWGVGGAWNRDGVILFGDTTGLFRVPASGGPPSLLIRADPSRKERGYAFPQFLPDGNRFVYLLASDDAEAGGIYGSSLDRPADRVRLLRTGTKAVYAAASAGGSGHLLFLRDRALLAQRFDAATLALEGDPVPLADDIATLASLHAGAFWSSDTGVLAYRSGVALEKVKLTWMSRDGKRLGSAGPDEAYTGFRLSPDGRRAVLGRRTPIDPGDLWVLEFVGARTTRFTFDPKVDACPTWSPDGRQIAFSSDRGGARQIYRKDVDGAGQEERLSDGPGSKCVMDWSRDARALLYGEFGKSLDLWALPVDAGRKPIAVLQTPFDEADGQFSPDGRWIAYTSNESGRNEVYVTAFDPASGSSGGKWQVSNQGGRAPRWRGDGNELFYLTVGGAIMAADIRTSAREVETGRPRELFAAMMPANSGDTPYPYDVAADGQRFLIQEPTEIQSSPLTLILNWQTKLKP